MAKRIADNVERGRPVTVTVDGRPTPAFAGETLATVVLAAGVAVFNRSGGGEPRAPYCNMGTCFECQVKVAAPGSSSFRWLRACMTPARDGMAVVTGECLPAAEPGADAD